MRNAAAGATWSDKRAGGTGTARAALFVLALVAAGFGVSQVAPAGVAAAAGTHSVVAAQPADVGSGEGPNHH